jgi:sulfide:quinone oxidoreductase
MAGKSVVILGGGVGGLVTANELRTRLGREHRIVLVDKGPQHVFSPSLIWLQVGLREPGSIVSDLSRLTKKGVEVVQGEITTIDPGRRTVAVDGAELMADYLVVALGADLAPEQVPGLSEAGHNLYSLEGATAIRDARLELFEGRLVLLVARMPFKCPAAPYAAVMLLDHDLRRRRVRDSVSVSLYSPEPGPMGVAGPDVSAGIKTLIEDRGIAYHPKHLLTEVDAAGRTLRFENAEDVPFDLLVYIPPHVVPPVIRAAGLAKAGGWVPVDRQSMETKHSDVFAIGDVVGIPLSMGLPLPKAGVFAHHQGRAVARTIAARATGRCEEGAFSGNGECFVEVGGGRAGYGSGNFYAEPTPQVRLRSPSRLWHVVKVMFEKRWLKRWL